LFICLAQICIVAAYFSMNATIIYFARYVLKNTEVLVEIVVARKLLGMLVGVPLAAWLVKHIGRKGAFMVGLGAYITGFALLYCFRTTDVALILAFFSVISVGQMLTASMAFALQSDTVEYGEYVTGERVEGMSYALFSFARKCGQALGGAIPAFVLAASGYVPNLANQSADSVSGIYAAMTLIPASLLGLTLLGFIFYPLTERRYAEILAGIQARRPREVGELARDDGRVTSVAP
jgi:glucuronide carrier protein